MPGPYEPLTGDDDVVSIKNHEKDGFIVYYPMFKISQFWAEFKQVLASLYSDKREERWLGKGVECEVLRLGSRSWQKGKIRLKLSLEFCPDEPQLRTGKQTIVDTRMAASTREGSPSHNDRG